MFKDERGYDVRREEYWKRKWVVNTSSSFHKCMKFSKNKKHIFKEEKRRNSFCLMC